MDNPFPFIDIGRQLEVEAVEGGRASNEFATSPYDEDYENAGLLDNVPVNFRHVDDIGDTEERKGSIDNYIAYASHAYADRGLMYPFIRSNAGDRFEIKPGMKDLARQCAALSSMISLGGVVAKAFEKRSVTALSRLLGGWHANVGSPWEFEKNTANAISCFRNSLGPGSCGAEIANDLKNNTRGDFGVDGLGILGRTWGGPILFMQSKNAPLKIEKFAAEFLTCGDAAHAWFGRRFDQFRTVIYVCAVNTILTVRDKENLFQRAGQGRGYHILDAVDIVLAESSDKDESILQNGLVYI